MSRYILAIDQSTSASKAYLVDEQGRVVRSHSLAHEQFYPAPGFVEHDANQIYANVVTALQKVCEGIPCHDVMALAIANQRETTVLWDRATGEPVCRALVWQDGRAQALCEGLSDRAQAVANRTGLTLSPYYSGAKAAWMLAHDPSLQNKALAGELMIGTVDSYLIYRLSGKKAHATDVSNASRTQLMNLETLAWDGEICGWFGIPEACLPQILPSDALFAQVAAEGLPGVPIRGVMGDSHAALFGQGCVLPGMAKATYGTGSSVMMHVGDRPVRSRHGVSACVGFGFAGQTSYVLEGNITCSGDTLRWLCDEMGMLQSPQEAEAAAQTVADTQGVYLVPAFAGLGAPRFDSRARALICGMSRGTTRAHVVRAALESMAYQVCDVARAMAKDAGRVLTDLAADGGPSRNALLMQFQADLLDCGITCAAASELSALGAAYMAGIALGMWPSIGEIPARREAGKRYAPAMDRELRERMLNGWEEAVERAMTVKA